LKPNVSQGETFAHPLTMNIACVADTHLGDTLPRESRAYFPHLVDSLGAQGNRFFERMSKETRRAYEAVLGTFKEKRYDRIVHLGDVTGGWQEQGIWHPVTQGIATEVRDDLRAICSDTRFCIGNHDAGYTKFGTLEESHTKVQSIESCAEIFGDLYWSSRDGDMLSIGACSPLAEYDGRDAKLIDLQKDHADFIRQQLNGHKHSPWMMYTHDLTILDHIGPVVRDHAAHCQKIVYGGMHHPERAALLRTLYKLKNLNKPPMRSLIGRATLCPGTAPFWWKGYERMDIISQEGSIRTKRIEASRPADSDRLPTESMIRCLLAMYVPRLVGFDGNK
jgi:hypothetical protein